MSRTNLGLQAKTFAIFLAGDLLGTLGLRLCVMQSQWAVLEAAVSALLWVWGVRLAARGGTTPAVVLGIVIGVEIGILIPLQGG